MGCSNFTVAVELPTWLQDKGKCCRTEALHKRMVMGAPVMYMYKFGQQKWKQNELRVLHSYVFFNIFPSSIIQLKREPTGGKDR